MDFDSLIIEYLTGGLRGENAREFLRMVETDEECARRFDELNRLYASSLTPYHIMKADAKRTGKNCAAG